MIGKQYRILPCPICGKKQKIEKPSEGHFPIQECKPSMYEHSFYVNPDLTVRKFTKEESEMLGKCGADIVKTCPVLLHNALGSVDQ